MPSLKRMGRFMRPYKWVIIIGIFTVITPVAMELAVQRLLQYVIDSGIRAGDLTAVWWGGGMMVAAGIVTAVAALAQGVCRAQLSQGLAFDMRNELIAHIQSFSFANLDEMRTGQLITRVSSDVDAVRMFTSAGVALLIRMGLMLIGSVIMLVITDWQLSLAVFVLLAISAVILRWLMQTAQPLFAQVQRKLGALNTIVQENLAGVRVVKAYVRERFAVDRFEEGNVDYRDENIRVGRLLALATPVLTIIATAGTVGVIWWGGNSVIGGRLSVGELIAFNNYLMIGMSPLLMLSNLLMMVSRAEASAERVFNVLDTVPKIQVAASPYKLDSATAKARGRVVFENVSFRYVGTPNQRNGKRNGAHVNGIGRAANIGRVATAAQADTASSQNGHGSRNGDGTPNRIAIAQGLGSEEVLDNVSLTVEPGQRVALLGATGSGKTSLINMIPRFYDITAGRVLIDDVDVREWAPESLRKQIGVVMQRTTLFSGTVRENIAFGRPDASTDEVIAAAKAAQAHEFIVKMPDAYESRVEARGNNLSGGQRQRIAIARALLIAPSILIFDDSTSAVDFETEVKIQNALDELMAQTTTFIIAQRINSVLNADQILVLDNGRIVARGTHRELLESSTIYREIYDSQMGESSAN